MHSIRLDALVKEMDELNVTSIAVPRPTPNQVRIRVESAGANFFDYLMCRGEYQTKPPLPFTPGCEFAGVVLECGSKVSSVSVGARVCGMAPHGCFQQQMCIAASSCVLIPEQMSFDEAAGFLMTNGTSYVGLVCRGGLKAGETLLVHAAAGGVGLAAVQIARALGAKTIIGTVGSDDKIDVVKRAGAHHVINYAKNKDWANEVLRLTEKRGVDVVYDPVGGDIFTESIKCTAWLGRILIVGFAGGKIASVATNRLLLKQISVVGVYFGSYMQHWPQKLAECFQVLFCEFFHSHVMENGCFN
jgi:NADPH2:quinone reductase